MNYEMNIRDVDEPGIGDGTNNLVELVRFQGPGP